MLRFGEEKEWKVRPDDKYGISLKAAYRQQKLIGVRKIWCGLITQKLGDIQEDTYRRWKLEQNWTGTSWARMVVRFILKFFEELWEERNNKVHPTAENSQREYLQNKIKKFFLTKCEYQE